jgi:oxygen-independent coproporphyrinogen-3 oxidase
MDAIGKDNQCTVPQALYVHVPFCLRKCDYCDFYSVAISPDRQAAYLAGIELELAHHVNQLTTPLASVFLGGGTPTALSAPALRRLLDIIDPLTDEHTELSLEANPGTLSDETLAAITQAGVNRINLGAQSFNDAELRAAGRIHTAAEARNAFIRCRQAGIENVGVDLILALPSQDESSWRDSLTQAIDLGPTHMSCYALTTEPDTPLGRRAQCGGFIEMPDDTQRHLYDLTVETLNGAGIEQYEISNFARPGFECRHNLTYWHNEAYLGLGPGAASYVGGVRWTNHPDLDAWTTALAADQEPPADSESLSGLACQAETIMLALRLTAGLNRAAFARRFGCDVLDIFGGPLRRHAAAGLVIISPDRVQLTPEAMFVANTVLADIIAEVSET